MKRLFALLLLTGCALTSKAALVDIRYFSPEAQQTPLKPNQNERTTTIRLGRITSSALLRSKIVHRESGSELGTYETLRWTDNPEVFITRSLDRVLFEDGPFREGVSGDLPTLDVDLVAFEEVHLERKRAGRVQLRYRLHDDHVVLTSGLITAQSDASREDIDVVVAAIGTAMNDACGQLVAILGAPHAF